MDVARPFFDCHRYDCIGKPDNRGALRLLLKVSHTGIFLNALFALNLFQDIRLEGVDTIEEGMFTIRPSVRSLPDKLCILILHKPLKILFSYHNRFNSDSPDKLPHLIDCQQVIGIHHCKGKGVVGICNRKHFVDADNLLRDKTEDIRVWFQPRQRDKSETFLQIHFLNPPCKNSVQGKG